MRCPPSRLLFIQIQSICRRERGLVNSLISGPILSNDERRFIAQATNTDIVRKIFRATLNRHLPREMGVADTYGNVVAGSPFSNRKRSSAIWKYLSVAETAYAVMPILLDEDMDTVNSLTVILCRALRSAAGLCHTFFRSSEAKLYEGQADMLVG